MKKITIGNCLIGDDEDCFVIAEMGLSHDGSLGAAYAFVDASSQAGASAVKFQTHIAESESSAYEQFRKGTFFPQDKSRFDYWLRTSFTEEQWQNLKLYTESKGLVFLSSPFCEDAVDMLTRIGIKAFKISSGEACNRPMIEKIINTRRPIILSTGMISMEETAEIVSLAKHENIPIIVCQCTTSYPCPPERLGLNMIRRIKDEFNVLTGFSDHSGTIFAGLGAVMSGACLLEVHVTFSRKCFGPDVSSSLTFEELTELVRGVKFLKKTMINPLDKQNELEKIKPMRNLFSKGVFAKKNIAKGSLISLSNICFKKPQIGIPAKEYKSVIGKKTVRKINAGNYISLEDIK